MNPNSCCSNGLQAIIKCQLILSQTTSMLQLQLLLHAGSQIGITLKKLEVDLIWTPAQSSRLLKDQSGIYNICHCCCLIKGHQVPCCHATRKSTQQLSHDALETKPCTDKQLMSSVVVNFTQCLSCLCQQHLLLHKPRWSSFFYWIPESSAFLVLLEGSFKAPEDTCSASACGF